MKDLNTISCDDYDVTFLLNFSENTKKKENKRKERSCRPRTAFKTNHFHNKNECNHNEKTENIYLIIPYVNIQLFAYL